MSRNMDRAAGAAGQKLKQIQKQFASGKNGNRVARKINQLKIIPLLNSLSDSMEDGGSIDSVTLLLLAQDILVYLKNRDFQVYPQLMRPMIRFIARINPDGMISSLSFREALKGTSFKPEDVIRELQAAGYMGLRYLLPKFRPWDESFVLELGSRYQGISGIIVEALLKAVRENPAVKIFMELLGNSSLKEIRGELCRGLGEIGHPASLDVLEKMGLEAEEEAVRAVIKIFRRDLHELKELLDQGIDVDVWGQGLQDKVHGPVNGSSGLLVNIIRTQSLPFELRKEASAILLEVGLKDRNVILSLINYFSIVINSKEDKALIRSTLVGLGGCVIPVMSDFLKQESPDYQVSLILISILEEMKEQFPSAVEVLEEMEELKEELKPAEIVLSEEGVETRPSVVEDVEEVEELGEGESEEEMLREETGVLSILEGMADTADEPAEELPLHEEPVIIMESPVLEVSAPEMAEEEVESVEDVNLLFQAVEVEDSVEPEAPLEEINEEVCAQEPSAGKLVIELVEEEPVKPEQSDYLETGKQEEKDIDPEEYVLF